MRHEIAGRHYTHGNNKIYRHINSVKDTFNNGIASLYRAKSWSEDKAMKLDNTVKTAYSIYSTLEPFLGIDADTGRRMHGAKAGYNAISYSAREIWNNPVRELAPYASRALATNIGY